MGLINFLKNIIGKAEKNLSENHSYNSIFHKSTLSRNIGITTAECPYCSFELPIKPSRKTKCPNCGKFIYKRTRPFDNADILIREDQINQIEEEWSIVNGNHDIYLKEKSREQRIRDEMRERFGREPDDSDVEFRVLNDQAVESAFEGMWGFARNSRMKMAKNLEKRKRYELALRMYFHVCFYDLNGPNNVKNNRNDHYPYFTPENAQLAPGIIKRMKKLITELNFDEEDCEIRFLEVSEPVFEGTPTTLKPEKAWPKLNKKLFD